MQAHSSRQAGRENIHLARSTAGGQGQGQGQQGGGGGGQLRASRACAGAGPAGVRASADQPACTPSLVGAAHGALAVAGWLAAAAAAAAPTRVLWDVLWALVAEEKQAELHVRKVKLGQQPGPK